MKIFGQTINHVQNETESTGLNLVEILITWALKSHHFNWFSSKYSQDSPTG